MMNLAQRPTNLGKQNGAVVLEVVKVLGRPVTIAEVAQRVSTVYKLPLDIIQPVVAYVLRAGEASGFFECRLGCYSPVPSVVEQLSRDVDEYAAKILAGGKAEISPLMLKLQRLDKNALIPGSRHRLVYLHDAVHPKWISVDDNE
ncbi:uncharacterized protein LOC108155527 [Drosophila miranda]|uniref:uncharacterized protein LOC108155527 n=1 Tax=Drosophila miranda TaxID=7229 RepID=UPI0007E7E879|nr:uncharacterized protein LOC108155527 [Drosophila miranda]